MPASGLLQVDAADGSDTFLDVDCFACGWNARIESAPPREAVLVEGGWRVALAIGCSLPGWLVVLPTRHVTAMDELTEDEAAALGPLVRRLSIGLREVTGCEKTYVALFAEQEGFAHLHVHVAPRMPWFTDDQKGPKSLAAFLGKPADEATTEPDRDDMALALRTALADARPLATGRRGSVHFSIENVRSQYDHRDARH